MDLLILSRQLSTNDGQAQHKRELAKVGDEPPHSHSIVPGGFEVKS
jgi:hypothetical protein